MLCAIAMAPGAQAFSEANSNSATVQFEVVIPAVVGVRIAADGQVRVVSNSGQVFATHKPTAPQRRFPDASDPPDYSSEIDIQTFDIDREFRSNPSLGPARLGTLLEANRATLATTAGSARPRRNSTTGLSGGSGGSPTPLTFSAP
ncbi:MAG: hypothetical protein OEW21_07000 [Betaproteobacteria bacterium]|nr:hypothetical protein [Betaproteobacteria bacterium]